MTPKQKMWAAVFSVNHAKTMLATAQGMDDDPNGYRAGYLEWAEQALLRAAQQVKELRNEEGTKKVGFSRRKLLTL